MTSAHGTLTALRAAEPAGQPSEPAGALRPYAGTGEDGNDLGALAGAAFDREIVDFAATAAVGVEQLVVEDVAGEVDPAHQFCPTLVRIMRGTAVIATIRITAR